MTVHPRLKRRHQSFWLLLRSQELCPVTSKTIRLSRTFCTTSNSRLLSRLIRSKETVCMFQARGFLSFTANIQSVWKISVREFTMRAVRSLISVLPSSLLRSYLVRSILIFLQVRRERAAISPQVSMNLRD